MENIKILISRDRIRGKVAELAAQVQKDYADRNPLLIGVLKGSFMFMADLVRALDMPLEVEFVRLSSYGSAKESSGEVEVIHDVNLTVEGRDVLVVEDIVDTGLSLRFLLDNLQGRNPSSLRLCTLLDKPSRRKTPVEIDYLGFTIPDKFVVGYGLDFNERFRNLPDVCYLEDD
ncbi:MAG: hypoxanthine phosphoribosyltransferase [Dehalococcoidia bacterium]